jgi:hypothetical protein
MIISLGSILAFDILCNQETPGDIKLPGTIKHVPSIGVDLADLISGNIDPRHSPKPREEQKVDFPKLDFEVEKLFCIGSPVALFLLLRGDQIRAPVPGSLLTEPGIVRPRVKSLSNVFHPHDVIAYRMEPMMRASLAKSIPQLMGYTKGGITGINNQLGSTINQLSSSGSFLFLTYSIVKSNISQTYLAFDALRTRGLKIGQSVVDTISSPFSKAENDAPVEKPELVSIVDEIKDEDVSDDNVYLLNSKGRLDFSLQEGLIEHSYLSALNAHISYWQDQVLIAFVLKARMYLYLCCVISMRRSRRRNRYQGILFSKNLVIFDQFSLSTPKSFEIQSVHPSYPTLSSQLYSTIT